MMGGMAADLKAVGTIPADREEWTMVMTGSREERKDLTKTEGKGSSWQVEGLDWRLVLEILAEDGREKTKKGRVGGASSTKMLEAEFRCL